LTTSAFLTRRTISPAIFALIGKTDLRKSKHLQS